MFISFDLFININKYVFFILILYPFWKKKLVDILQRLLSIEFVCICFFTECTDVPSVENSISTVNGSAPITHGKQINYTCKEGFLPKTIQSVFCGKITPGKVDVSNITCSRISIV